MNRDDTRKNIRNASFRRYTILSDSLNTLSNTAHCRSTCCKWSNTTKLFICIMLVLMAQNEIDDITMCRGMKKVCFYYFGAGDDWMRSIENTSHSIEREFFPPSLGWIAVDFVYSITFCILFMQSPKMFRDRKRTNWHNDVSLIISVNKSSR